jgi:uncharacterized protein YegJ (DUF2314 family)
MKKFVMAAALLASLSATAGNVGDKTVLIESEDAEMHAAIQKAQASLDQFLAIQAQPPKGASGFKLKVKFTDGQASEHMWVIPFKQVKGKFVGTLADEPEYVSNVRNGQQVTFPRASITDWGYVLDGKQKGSFTVCVVFKHMPAAEVKHYREQYGFEC